jgi:hypothetical protein
MRAGVKSKVHQNFLSDPLSHLVSLIDVRIARGSLQEGPHLFPSACRMDVVPMGSCVAKSADHHEIPAFLLASSSINLINLFLL